MNEVPCPPPPLAPGESDPSSTTCATECGDERGDGLDDPLERLPDSLAVQHRPDLDQRALVARASFSPGDIVQPFSAKKTLRRPSRMTVQVAEHEHVLLTPSFLENVNHGCEPNVCFDTERWALVALTTIAPGDELVFFYPSTEWRMASGFPCACGSARCLGRIHGASRLGRQALAGHWLAPHIHRLIALEEPTERALEMGLFLPMFAPA